MIGYMNRFSRVYLLIALGCFIAVQSAFAQRNPYIGYIYPAGGKVGSTFYAYVSGQNLDGVTNALVSCSGVTVEVLEYIKPLNGRQINLLRDRVRNIQQALKNAPRTAKEISFYNELNTNKLETLTITEAEKELMEIKKKLSNPKNQRPPNPQLAEDVRLKITIQTNAEPGEYELRLRALTGYSNPMVFQISNLPEFAEQENDLSAVKPGTYVSLPCIINGRIMPGDVDKFGFSARKGQKIVAIVYARYLIPYIADAVPGWFQATLKLYDSKGKELAYIDDFKFNPDPVLYYEIPADGEYMLEIKDAIYRGREDFVYRIAIGELPFITSIFPLGCKQGDSVEVELKGWNLPTSKITPDTKNCGITMLSVTKSNLTSNLVPFAVDNLPELAEKEPNDNLKTPHPVSLPVIINGIINKPGDRDVYSFTAQAGSVVVAEVMARRLNSPLDSIIEITDITGKRLAINDDNQDLASGLLTHHADSYISFPIPTTGRYFLHITDSQHKGGAEFAYRLRISPPRPDFELRVVPASVNMRAGSSFPITVYAIRRDGFTNDIKLNVKSPSQGFSLGQNPRIPGTTNQVKLTLTAANVLPLASYNIIIEGRATVNGEEIIRTAQPAQDMMQAFYYHHLVPAKNLVADVFARQNAPQQKPKVTPKK